MATWCAGLLPRRRSSLLQRFADASGPQEMSHDVGRDQDRVELTRAPQLAQRIIVSSERRARPTVMLMRLGTAETEFEGSQGGAFSACPIEVEGKLDQGRDAVSFSQFLIDLQCVRSRFFCESDSLLRRFANAAPDTEFCMGPGNAGPSEGETRIAVNGGVIVENASAITFFRVLMKPVAASQVEFVSRKIVRWPPAHARPFVVR